MNKYRKCRKGWQLLVRTLALAVVFCTTYVLILPAITMQEDAVCGMEEHVHTDACYSQPQAQLTGCGIEADVVVHQHNDLCRNAAGELICTLAEQAVHVHEDSCHDMDTVLACMVTHVHSEACVKTESTQVCTLEESEGHAHSERCTGTQTVQVCTDEAHAHTEACVEVQTLTCEIPETAGHAHGETCFAVNEIPCTEPTAADHVHEEGCWQQMDKLVCGREELRLHTHGETCVDAEGSLICTLPVVVEHIHTDACLVAAADAEPVQTCEQQEHVHTEACYPLKEDAVIGPSYHCGYDAHNHGASCYELDETLKCSIPVHTHDTTCLLDDLDLTADLETAEIWEATLEDVELTGVWADDLLAVAKTQLGYRESEKNCILFEEELRGYTRYGAWYGNDYGKWDDMFIAFCLHYAEIDEESMPRESDTARWIQDLAEKNLYQEDLTTAPVPGDLVFLDTDEDEEADFAAIVAELLPENEIRIIAGDTEQNCVASQTLKRSDETLVGFGKLPENPNPEKTDVSALLAELPEADALKATLNAYQTSGDRTGFEKELTILTARLDAISTAYEALSDEEKAQVTGGKADCPSGGLQQCCLAGDLCPD